MLKKMASKPTEQDTMNNDKSDKSLTIYLGIFNTIYFVLLTSTRQASPLFFLPFQNELDGSATQTTSIYTIRFIFSLMGGPIYGAFFKIFGARISLITGAILTILSNIATSLAENYATFAVFFGVIRGIGAGLVNISALTVNAHSFSHSLAFLNNVMSACGSTVGAGLAPLLQLGFDHYTWRGVMLLMGGLSLNMIPFGWLTANLYKRYIKTSPRQSLSMANTWNIVTASLDVNLMKDLTFVIYLFSYCGIETMRMLKVIFLVRYAQSIGISDQAASLFITMYQVPYIATSLITGYTISKLSKRFANNESPVPMKTSKILIYASVGMFFTNFIPIIWKSYNGYAVYTILSGIVSGICGKLPTTLVSELFGSERASSGLGFRSLFLGITLLIVTPLLGLVIDSTGSYQPVVYFSSFFSLLGSSCLKVAQMQIDKRDKEVKQENAIRAMD